MQSYILVKTDPPSVTKELVCELLQELDPYKLMGTDIIHPSVLRELPDVFARPLYYILEVLEIEGYTGRLEKG